MASWKRKKLDSIFFLKVGRKEEGKNSKICYVNTKIRHQLKFKSQTPVC